MDETAQLADLVLPNHIYLERYEDVPAPHGFPLPIISLARPVSEPQLNTMHTGDVVILLAKALGGPGIEGLLVVGIEIQRRFGPGGDGDRKE